MVPPLTNHLQNGGDDSLPGRSGNSRPDVAHKPAVEVRTQDPGKPPPEAGAVSHKRAEQAGNKYKPEADSTRAPDAFGIH